MGGTSSEREVSLMSGKNVAEALKSLGKYEVIPVDVKDDTLDAMPKDVNAAYIALHGGWGENGGVQAALNALKIPYTGPGVLASQIAMDMVKTKMVLEMKNVPTAKWGLANPDTEKSPLPLPVVVKPPCDGSSVGISKVSSEDQWKPALKLAGSDPVLVEEFIPGREFTVAVVDGEAWPVIEIVAKGGWYGYEEKYNSDETKYPFLCDQPATRNPRNRASEACRASVRGPWLPRRDTRRFQGFATRTLLCPRAQHLARIHLALTRPEVRDQDGAHLRGCLRPHPPKR